MLYLYLLVFGRGTSLYMRDPAPRLPITLILCACLPCVVERHFPPKCPDACGELVVMVVTVVPLVAELLLESAINKRELQLAEGRQPRPTPSLHTPYHPHENPHFVAPS